MDDLPITIRLRQAGDQTWSLILHTEDVIGDVVETLAAGFATPADAMAALAESLTAAPPELEIYDVAVQRVSSLADQMEEAEGAIQTLGGRLNTVEDRLEGMTLPAAAVGPKPNRLLPGREAAHGVPVTPTPPARPKLRTRTLDIERATGSPPPGRVHGALYGGVSRRGAAPPLMDEEDQ